MDRFVIRRSSNRNRVAPTIAAAGVLFSSETVAASPAALGCEPELGRVFAIEQVSAVTIGGLRGGLPAGGRRAYRRCANLNTPAACNGQLSDLDKIEKSDCFCVACRLNRTIPDLSVPENGVLWGRIESAKRRLVSPGVGNARRIPGGRSATEEVPQRGMAFDFLRSPKEGPRVLTGHANGLITLNIEETDPVTRESVRENLNEPYRTILGHLRHEVGHYYWVRLIFRDAVDR